MLDGVLVLGATGQAERRVARLLMAETAGSVVL